MLVLVWFSSSGSRSAHADDNADPATILTASATSGQTALAESTQADTVNEAPMPTEVPGGTVTPQSTSLRPTETRTEVPGAMSPTPRASSATSTPTYQATPRSERWEVTTLRDFAETVGWPPVVMVDPNDRLSVRKSSPAGEEWSASIRAFGFRAGAEAAFSAEQEDARLAGYQLSQETFYTFPAYAAHLAGQNGTVVGRRYRWLVDSWVLGIEVRDSAASQAAVEGLARQLLVLAAHNGLPVLPNVLDSATPSAQSQDVRTPEGCSVSFGDVPEGMWAYSYIRELACTGVVSGYPDGTFRPQNPTTRAQLVKMVVLLEEVALHSPPVPTFADVPAAHVFYRYVETAAGLGLIGGYTDGSFKPDAPVSRAQVAKIVVKARGWELVLPSTSAILCDVSASHWAYSYIQVAIAHGIFTGYGDGCFRPDDFATRAQLAKVLVLSHP
ncbi:MAG: S-layer homology domain-containing protein [Chloroflexota bacterium]|nr:S-layer homology domain-containing protein [Chloroflexota bacterium]MDQ5864134.1 S-layer homology domain-containing protein [Chloroflexota bacterium]